MSSTDSTGRRRVAEEQVLLNELPSRNGVSITPTRTPLGKRGGATLKEGASSLAQLAASLSQDLNSFGPECEKQPFLATEPVRLTPAWEETNLPNDELNFKELSMEQAQLEMNPPHDRLNIVYLILLLHGIGILMPWNMFITAKDYFVSYKLSKNYTGVDSDYQTHFMPYLEFASQGPNLIFNWLNIFVQIGGNLTSRIVWSVLTEVVIFVVTVIMAMGDSSSWPGIFFWATMATVVVINMANGIYQNTVFGLAAKMPYKYTGAVVLGTNLCGIMTACISIASKFFSPNARTAAIYYFITALFVLLACLDTYFALPLNRFYRYHDLIAQKEIAKRQGGGVRVPYGRIFRQCFPQCFNVFMIFFVSLSIFPAVQAEIKYNDGDFFGSLTKDHFSDITCFLTFNIFAFIGNFIAAFGCWPGPKSVVVPVLLRLLFIPAFLFCKYEPTRVTRILPTIITNDWVYWTISALFSLTSGYFSSVCMMYCPRSVEPQYASTAGMFAAACLITGIVSGIMFSAAMPWFVSNVSLDWLSAIFH